MLKARFPDINLEHFFTLCDDTGLFQHATHGVPNRKEGYCTDDVARAIIFLCKYPLANSNPHAIRSLATCLSFLHFASTPEGLFHNFLSFDRHWLDDAGSEDSHGRAMWALGTASNCQLLTEASRGAAVDIFSRGLLKLRAVSAPRSFSFGMLGCAEAPNLDQSRIVLGEGGSFLTRIFRQAATSDWQWFERDLTYCNARICHSLYAAYSVLKHEEFLDVAERSMRFLIGAIFDNGILGTPGNTAWYKAGGPKSPFDQQPVEAGCTAEALLAAYRVTGNQEYLDYATRALMWYHGANRLGMNLVDETTGACYDGLQPTGVNRNQGAEALLSYLLARVEYDRIVSKLI